MKLVASQRRKRVKRKMKHLASGFIGVVIGSYFTGFTVAACFGNWTGGWALIVVPGIIGIVAMDQWKFM